MRSIKRHLTTANLIPILALFFALAGGALAVTATRNSVGSRSVANASLKGVDFLDNGLGGQDISEETMVLPSTPQGQKGEKGSPGDPGQDGSPETGQQVLDKLKTVQGPGSGLDVDRFDGLESCQTDGVITVDDDDPELPVCTHGGTTLSVDCNATPANTTPQFKISQTTAEPSGRGFSGVFSAGNSGTTLGAGLVIDAIGGSPTAGATEFFSAQSDGGGFIGSAVGIADATGVSDGTCYFIAVGID